jgi:hypothetical protein
MPDIASVQAHTAQIAMTDFMKRMSGFLPRCTTGPRSCNPA